jgi:hypothetical protein
MEHTVNKVKISAWDIGPDKAFDRYTIGVRYSKKEVHYFGMSSNPGAHQGFNQYLGSNLDGYSPNENWGKEVSFTELPEIIQKATMDRIES